MDRVTEFQRKVLCHRVIVADGSLGGFFGEKSADALARKRALLESEGVKFVEGVVVR